MNLQLSLKRKWFELTKAGIKTEDYREITPYWFKRLVFDYKKFCKYVNVDPNKIEDIEMICRDKFWSRTIAYKLFDTNTLTLGYPSSADTERIIKFKHAGIEIRTGNPEWGAEPDKLYFVIKHGEIIKQ